MDTEKYNKKLRKRISEYSGHLMNDTKWRKIFKLLSNKQMDVSKVRLFDIWEEKKQSFNELDIDQLINFEKTFNNNGINDVLIGGPMKFKEIKKIIIETNSLRNLSFEIDKLGVFEKEVHLEKIIILGYK